MEGLKCVRQWLHADLEPPTDTDALAEDDGCLRTEAPTCRDALLRLPAGTRVLVQRLGAKPGYSGKRARVRPFD
jgi:hypothetical protein